MSIGYETQIPPISTVTFYNAIANNGKMLRPRFVKAVQKDGQVVKEMPVEVIKEQIASPKAIEQIREMLLRVVSEGVGKRAGSKYFAVAGKTGTAQIGGKGGYKGGGHLVSFCGYFPAEKPQYTCIVAIRLAHGLASGGGQAGPVFKKIAESVYANAVTSDLSRAKDSLAVFVPQVKKGYVGAAQKVLETLNVKTKAAGLHNDEMGVSAINGNEVSFTALEYDFDHIPDLKGMGLRDAVYEIERRGMKAKVKGAGKVVQQSLQAGTKNQEGQTIEIVLKQD